MVVYPPKREEPPKPESTAPSMDSWDRGAVYERLSVAIQAELVQCPDRQADVLDVLVQLARELNDAVVLDIKAGALKAEPTAGAFDVAEAP